LLLLVNRVGVVSLHEIRNFREVLRPVFKVVQGASAAKDSNMQKAHKPQRRQITLKVGHSGSKSIDYRVFMNSFAQYQFHF